MARNFIDEINELKRQNVHIKDPETVNRKLTGIIHDGFNQLQVVSDFDLTLTKQHESGKAHMSSFRMFTQCPSIPDNYLEVTKKLQAKYRPLEFDPTIPMDVKRVLMEEWWSKSEAALKGLKVSQEEIDEVIKNVTPSLRDNTEQLFNNLNKNNVPVLVFSAGLGDIVVSVLKHFSVYLPTIKVISNFLNYNDNGTITGFKGRLIHVLNKNEHAVEDSDYFQLIGDRKNVILMGDSLGDAKMADGLPDVRHLLKIGFIYEEVEGNLPNYLDTFDIVLEDDQTMDVINAIINQIYLKKGHIDETI